MKTKKELLYQAKVNYRLIKYGILHNPDMYDNIPIKELSPSILTNEEQIKNSFPEYHGLVELTWILHEPEHKYWKWKKDIQDKVYLALMIELDHRLVIEPIRKISLYENMPDPKLAKLEAHNRANESYRIWFTKIFGYRNFSNLSVKHFVITTVNYLPIEFWEYASQNEHSMIQMQLRIILNNPKLKSELALLEGINQLVNFKFVKENYKDEIVKDSHIISLQKHESANENKLLAIDQTIVIYYLANNTDEYSQLNGLTDTSKNSKALMKKSYAQYSFKYCSSSTFVNYYCRCLRREFRVNRLNEQILNELREYPKAYEKVLKDQKVIGERK